MTRQARADRPFRTMPRLFLGLEIPPAPTDALSDLQTGLRDVRWIDPGDFHVTLRFIGDISPSEADDLAETLAASPRKRPTVALGELSTFGGMKPRSLYASVARDDRLVALADHLERLCRRLGHRAETRRFTPHVTLARLNAATDIGHLARWLSRHGALNHPPFVAERLALYSARESVGGGPYRVEMTFPFL